MTRREPTQAIQKTGTMLSTMPIYPNLINSRLSSHSLLLLYSSQLLHFKVHLQFLLFLQDEKNQCYFLDLRSHSCNHRGSLAPIRDAWNVGILHTRAWPVQEVEETKSLNPPPSTLWDAFKHTQWSQHMFHLDLIPHLQGFGSSRSCTGVERTSNCCRFAKIRNLNLSCERYPTHRELGCNYHIKWGLHWILIFSGKKEGTFAVSGWSHIKQQLVWPQIASTIETAK